MVRENFTPILGIVRPFLDSFDQKYEKMVINKEIIYFGHSTSLFVIVLRFSIQQGALNFRIGTHVTRLGESLAQISSSLSCLLSLPS
jgi:hypothetical protein